MPKHNITNEEKKQLFQRRLNGEAVSVIANDIGVVRARQKQPIWAQLKSPI